MIVRFFGERTSRRDNDIRYGKPSCNRHQRFLGADDRYCARPGAHVLQRGFPARGDGRNGEELQRPADDCRHRHRDVFDVGRRLRDARRQAQPALRCVARVSCGCSSVWCCSGGDDVQPQRNLHDRGARHVRRGRCRACSVARRPYRRELQRHSASNRAGRPGICARGGRRCGIPDRRHSGLLHRVATGLRNPDRAFGCCVLPELPAQAGPGAPGRADRSGRGGPRSHGHHPDQLRIQ